MIQKTIYLNQKEIKEFWQTLTGQASNTKYTSLQNKHWVGYIWMSDAPLKHILLAPSPLPLWENMHEEQNFVWEANLYCKDEWSLSIKQTNDQWIVSLVSWKESIAKQENSIEFLDHKYVGSGPLLSQKLLFQEAWIARKDEFCENKEVLQPAWIAFTGFEN